MREQTLYNIIVLGEPETPSRFGKLLRWLRFIRQTIGSLTMADEQHLSKVHHFSFPPWLQQLVYFIGVLVSVTWLISDIKHSIKDQGSKVADQSQQIKMISDEISAVRAALPNREIYDMKWDQLHSRIVELEEGAKVRVMLDQRLREQLIKKGVLE